MLKVVSESRVSLATSVPILVFIVLSVLDLGSMYATDRPTNVIQTDRETSAAHRRFMPLEQGILRESVVLLQHSYRMRLGILHAIAPRIYYLAHTVIFDDNPRYFTEIIILSMIDVSLKERFFSAP